MDIACASRSAGIAVLLSFYRYDSLSFSSGSPWFDPDIKKLRCRSAGSAPPVIFLIQTGPNDVSSHEFIVRFEFNFSGRPDRWDRPSITNEGLYPHGMTCRTVRRVAGRARGGVLLIGFSSGPFSLTGPVQGRLFNRIVPTGRPFRLLRQPYQRGGFPDRGGRAGTLPRC